MDILFYIAGAAAILGGIVGWFSRGRLYVAFPICALLSFLILVILVVSSASSDGVTWQNWPEAMVWYAFPFLLFIFLPCIVAGVLMAIVSHFIRRCTKHGRV